VFLFFIKSRAYLNFSHFLISVISILLFLEQQRFDLSAGLVGAAPARFKELMRRFDHCGAGLGGIHILQDQRCSLSPIAGDPEQTGVNYPLTHPGKIFP
jgi:hypothetical protein